MIITVTMNPAIDKTADVDNLRIGELNRVKNIIQDAGGKGINVSRTIHALGGDTIATGFLGGDAGKMIGLSLTQLNIKHDFVFIEGETRTNTKIIDKSNGNLVTELNEPGPDILPSELEQLCEKLEGYASPDNIFVFSGSIPNKISPSIYGQLIRKLKKKRAKVFVDADGELFRPAPFVKELVELSGLVLIHEKAAFLFRFFKRGIKPALSGKRERPFVEHVGGNVLLDPSRLLLRTVERAVVHE